MSETYTKKILIVIQYVSSKLNTADLLTKPMLKCNLLKFTNLIFDDFVNGADVR